MFVPDKKILKKYADVLVKYALGSGHGIKKGDVVFLQVPESAKPILNPLVISVLESGGNPLINYTPDGTDRQMSVDRVFLDHATEDQIKYLPKKYLLGRVADSDHFVSIVSTNNKKELEGVESKKILERQKAVGFYKQAREQKENRGKLTWTLGLYGTPAMAKEAGLTLKEYWDQIISAVFLDAKDPIKKWKEVSNEVELTKNKLNKLKIEKLFVKGKNVNLEVGLGKKRVWMGGSGRNIPSFELFISPNNLLTNGNVKFNQPVYIYGSLIKDVELIFSKGRVIKANASSNKKLLEQMISVQGADMIGEFSLTDKRFSRISKFMAETLFDENMGGEFGNFHIALGSAYKDSYPGDPSKVSKAEWKKLGYNESAVHTDIISTEDKEVVAELSNGCKNTIYKNGAFTF